MAKANKPQAESVHPLLDSLECISSELNLIRTVLDELRSDMQWAVQNGMLKFDPPPQSAAPDLTLFNEGDSVHFTHDGRPRFGEVIEIDDANNVASIAIIPGNEVVTTSQDSLRKHEPDPLQRKPTGDSNSSTHGTLF